MAHSPAVATHAIISLDERILTTGRTTCFSLDPRDPDTDGDGYWDGWIGVYGVGHSDNVILYDEHLQSGDGIEGDERVDEQVETHTYWEAPFALGADVEGNYTFEHSAIHLGELYWRTEDPSVEGHPDDGSVTPDPRVEFEVDWYEDADQRALDAMEDVEDNYALYGIDVDLSVSDDPLTDSDLQAGISPCTGLLGPRTPPTSYNDARWIECKHHDDDSKAYMFVTTVGATNEWVLIAGNWSDSRGKASHFGSDNYAEEAVASFGVIIFSENYPQFSPSIKYQKTTVHEIGHLLGAGLADDGTASLGTYPREVYSGNVSNDDTIEMVNLLNNPRRRWSVMSNGFPLPTGFPPMDKNYIAFSIEELSTIDLENIDTIEG